MARAGTVTIDFVAEVGGMVRNIDKATGQISGSFQKMERAAATFAKTAVGLAGAAGIGLLVKSAIDSADELSKLSQKVGLTTEQLSGLALGAKLSDVSLQQLQGGIVQLVNRQGDAAQGMKEYSRTFDALGIAVKNSDGSLRNSMDVLGDVADVFKLLPDGAEQTKLAVELFGRAGADLIPLFNEGREGLEAFDEKAKELSVSLDKETGKAAEAFNDQLTLLGTAVDGVGLSMAKELLPTLMGLAETLGSKDFKEGFTAIAVGAATAIVKVAELTGELGNFARFAGEELAARIHGAAADDIVRKEQEVANKRAELERAMRPALFDFTDDSLEKRLASELADLEAQLESAREAQARRTAGQREGNEETETGIDLTKDFREMLRGLWTDQSQAAEAAKREAAAVREAAKAASELRREKEAMRDLAASVYDVDAEAEQFLRLNLALEEAERRFGAASEEALGLRDAIDHLVNKTIADDAKKAFDDYNEWITRETEALDKMTAATDEAAARIRASLAQGIAGDVHFMFGRMFSDIDAGSDAWDAFGRAGVDALTSILGRMKDTGKGFGDLAKMLEDGELGDVIQALSIGIGSAAGGGGEGAAMGSALGSAIGFWLTAASGGWGAPIGAILGGLVGGTFDEDPEFHIGGSSHLVKGREQQGRTALGAFVAVRTDGMGRDSDDEAFQAILEFDQVIARLLPDEFEEGVAAALNDVFTRSELLETHLAERMVAVLGALPEEVGSFVEGWALDLQDRVQALGDVLALMSMEEAGELLSGTLEQTLLIIDEFAMAGETIGQAYQRLATAATSYAQVAAGVQEELLTADLTDFQKQVLAVQRLELQRTKTLEQHARAMGNLAAREEDLAAAAEAADRAIARLVAELRQASLDIAAELYGRSIADIDADLEALRAAQGEVTTVTEHATSALQGFGEEMQRAREIASATLNFGGLKGQELVDFALGALGRGEISLSEALQAGQRVFDSGADFNDFFARATSIFRSRPVSDPLGVTPVSAPTERAITPEEQALLDERAALEAEQEARRRLGLANDLAQNIADLASATGESFGEVMADLGFTPEQLAADLGLDSVASLDGFLESLQATDVFDGTLATTLETLPEDIARAMFDILRGGVPENVGGPDLPPGTGPGPRPEPPPGEGIIQGEKLADIEGHTGKSADTLLRIETLLERIERLEGQSVSNTGRAARGMEELSRTTARAELQNIQRSSRGFRAPIE